MPYTENWVDPEIFLVHNDITVYHCYKDDEMHHGPLKYTFTTKIDSRIDNSEDNPYVFDVKNLPNWSPCGHPPFLRGKGNTFRNKNAWNKWHSEGVEDKHIKRFICNAIDSGHIKTPPTPAGIESIQTEPKHNNKETIVLLADGRTVRYSSQSHISGEYLTFSHG